MNSTSEKHLKPDPKENDMTTPKALPPGTNHHAATNRAAAQVQGMADAAIDAHAGPRPEGPKKVMTAELQAKTLHRTVSK
jgi:hypothetical protein